MGSVSLMSQSQPNNQSARKGKSFKNALRYALKNYAEDDIETGQALKGIAKKLVKTALTGTNGESLQAINTIADRLDGKPAMAIIKTTNKKITLVQRVIVNQAVDNKEVIEGQVIQEAIEVSDH